MRGGQRDTGAMQGTSLIMSVRSSSQDSCESPEDREMTVSKFSNLAVNERSISQQRAEGL